MMDAAVLPESREKVRDPVSVTRFNGTEKTNGHAPNKPRVPPKHVGLLKNGLSQNVITTTHNKTNNKESSSSSKENTKDLVKESTKESLKESSAALTKLLCGEDNVIAKDGGEDLGNTTSSSSHVNRGGGGNGNTKKPAPNVMAKTNGVVVNGRHSSPSPAKRVQDTKRVQSSEGGNFSETVSRSPSISHQQSNSSRKESPLVRSKDTSSVPSRARDSSLTRSKSCNYGAKKTDVVVQHFDSKKPDVTRQREDDRRLKSDDDRSRDKKGHRGKAAADTSAADIKTAKNDNGVSADDHEQTTPTKAASKNISVRQQWMAKRRSLSNSPHVSPTKERDPTKDSETFKNTEDKGQETLNDHRITSKNTEREKASETASSVAAPVVPHKSERPPENEPLTNGLKVSRRKLGSRKDESRETLLVNGDTNMNRAGNTKTRGHLDRQLSAEVCTTTSSSFLHDGDAFDKVTIISGNLTGTQRGKVVYVERKHMHNSWSCGRESPLSVQPEQPGDQSDTCIGPAYPGPHSHVTPIKNSHSATCVCVADSVSPKASAANSDKQTCKPASKNESLPQKSVESVPAKEGKRSSQSQSLATNDTRDGHPKVKSPVTEQNQPLDAAAKASSAKIAGVPNSDKQPSPKKEIVEHEIDRHTNTEKNTVSEKPHTKVLESDESKNSARDRDQSKEHVPNETLQSKRSVRDVDQSKSTRDHHSGLGQSKKSICDNNCLEDSSKPTAANCSHQKNVTDSDSDHIRNKNREKDMPRKSSQTRVNGIVNEVVIKSPKPRTKTTLSVSSRSDTNVSDSSNSDENINNNNSIEMKTFKDNNGNSVVRPTSIATSTDNAMSSTGVDNDRKPSITVTISNATSTTTTTITTTKSAVNASTAVADSNQSEAKPRRANSSGSEKEKVYANEDSLPNSPQNVPEEGTTPTENVEITDLDFFKTDIVRSSRNGFTVSLPPSNSPRQVKEVAVATTPINDSFELTSIVRPGKYVARHSHGVTVAEIHHQPAAKIHTVDVVIASNAKALDSTVSSLKGSRSHPGSPARSQRPLRETSSSSSSRESSPEKKGDLAGAVTSSQDEKNRVRDRKVVAMVLSQDDDKKKTTAKESSSTSSAPASSSSAPATSSEDEKTRKKDLASAVTSSQDEKNRVRALQATLGATSSSQHDDDSSSKKCTGKGEPILKPKARTKSAKSVSFHEQTEVTSTQGSDQPLGFQLGLLKECEVQVQAFLEDADSVLAALDQCQAEEKCLMLIKRPKESAKKMLKSHSLTSLSVSDPQLYRQFNGLQVHQPIAQPPMIKGNRHSDEQSVTSNDTDRSDPQPRRRYTSNKENHSAKQQHRTSLPVDVHHNLSQDCSFGSDSSSVASDYQYVSRRDRDRDARRGDLRYSSIPEDDAQLEINNNKGGGGAESSASSSVYHSCHDLSFASQTSSAWSRGQGQGHGQGHGYPGQGPVLASDQMYGRQYQQRGSGGSGGEGGHRSHHHPPHPGGNRGEGPVHDPGDMEESARSQSLGNLTTGGLTLSLVGQRKADSMLDLASPTGSPPPLQSHHPPPRTHAPRPSRRSDGYPQQDYPRGSNGHQQQQQQQYGPPKENGVMSPRHGYRDAHNIRSPRVREEQGEAYCSPPPPPNGHHPNGDVLSPSHHRPQPKYNPHGNYNHHPNYAGGMPSRDPNQHPHQYPHPQMPNGYAGPVLNGSARGDTPQSDGAPPKPKRNLPNVPLNETSERIKRFTEMMKSRMSASSLSSNGRSTATPQTPTTPLSRQASINTDNGSDCEVSNLLDSRQRDAAYAGLPQKPQHPMDNVVGQEGKAVAVGGRDHPQHHAGPHPHPQQPYSSASFSSSGGSGRHASSTSTQQDTPYGGGDGSFASHSHSSTMDSGYTTNNEGDADSSIHTHHPHLNHQHHQQYLHQQQMLSPPHQHPQQHKPHGQPQQPPPYNQHVAQQGEAGRPVPVPRNLSLAGARKFNSMHNVSSQQMVAGPHIDPQSQPAAGPGPRTANKGPAPVRGQHTMNGYGGGGDHGHHPAVLEHQRRSWDLAHNLKSLDFVPLTPGSGSGPGAAKPTASQGREDVVVKPQPVSLSGGSSSNSGGSQPGSSAGSSPAHRPDGQRRDGQYRATRRPSWQEVVKAQEGGSADQAAPPPLPAQPPPVLEASGVSTLPGHWKYNNGANDKNNSVNNNNTSRDSSNNNSGSSSGPDSRNNSNHSTPQRTPPKLNNVDTSSTSNTTIDTSSAPSLFQLSQQHDLRSLKISLPPQLTVSQTLTLTTQQVTLPACSLDAGSPSATSPQGRTAKIGGPGSAFRKVKVQAGGGGVQTIVADLTAVATVGDVDNDVWAGMGQLRSGDVIVEINGRQCLGWEVGKVQEALNASQGDILLGIARRREEQTPDNRLQQMETSLRSLEQEVHKMKDELAKKDARILELSTMLPWKSDDGGKGVGERKVVLDSEEGAFVIGENEFVV